jgi:hypothetical protein
LKFDIIDVLHKLQPIGEVTLAVDHSRNHANSRLDVRQKHLTARACTLLDRFSDQILVCTIAVDEFEDQKVDKKFNSNKSALFSIFLCNKNAEL